MMKFNKLLCWHLKNHAMAWTEINDAKTIPRPVIWNSIMLYSTYIAGTTTKQQHNNSGFQQMISSLAFLDSKCYYATSIVKVRNTCCSQYVELTCPKRQQISTLANLTCSAAGIQTKLFVRTKQQSIPPQFFSQFKWTCMFYGPLIKHAILFQ